MSMMRKIFLSAAQNAPYGQVRGRQGLYGAGSLLSRRQGTGMGMILRENIEGRFIISPALEADESSQRWAYESSS